MTHFENQDETWQSLFSTEKEKIVQALQITETLHKDNEKREGVLEAMTKFKLKEGWIITLDEEREIRIENNKIHVLPLWKGLLE